MEKDYDRVYAITYDSLKAFRGLSRSARRILDLCVDQADEEGVAHLSRAGLMLALSVGRGTVDDGVKELARAGFAAQAGYSRLVVNRAKVWTTQRDRAEACLLTARFEQQKQGFAQTLAKKQAAGREGWRKRQALRGVKDGMVEEAGRGPRYEGDGEPPY